MEKRSGRSEVYVNEGNLARRPRQAERALRDGAGAHGRRPSYRDYDLYERRVRQSRERQRKMRRKRQMIVALLEILVVFIAGILLAAFLNSSRETGGNEVEGMGAGLQDFTGGELPSQTVRQTYSSSSSATPVQAELIQGLDAEVFNRHPEWEENFLTPNEYSRPGDPLTEVKNIFVHYTANPGTSAAQNRSYFEQQKDTHQASVSSHFIIGYEGEILQIVPLDEIAYAVMTRNMDSISIECCYKEKDGSFTQETYDSLIALLSWLTDAYELDTEDILRHYDCGGKKCPLYYTEHPDAWEQLKQDVADYQP